MSEQKIIESTKEYVKQTMAGDSSHDWWHVYRVWKVAKYIAKQEQADSFVVELGALLHDISDWKFNDGDFSVGANMATEWLKKNNVEQLIIDHVNTILHNVSFKGANVKVPDDLSIENKVVQDADRLDAIGAMGIARAFAYGGYMRRDIYNPDIPPEFHDSFESYKNNNASTLNHFYEKLLLLKDRMQTKTGRALAEKRHAFMEAYIQQFFIEWEPDKSISELITN
jgi:uncharacterized protein